jgi:hypothetical protein
MLTDDFSERTMPVTSYIVSGNKCGKLTGAPLVQSNDDFNKPSKIVYNKKTHKLFPF